MSISFACGNCGKPFTVDDKFAGKKGKCKQCGAVMAIPEAVASVAARAEIAPSRRPSRPAQPAHEADVYGFDEAPARSGLPSGIEEVEGGSPLLARPRTGSRGLYDPPSKKKKGSGGGAFGTVGKGALGGLGVLLAVVALWGVRVALKTMSSAVINSGWTSRVELEAILQERVNLNNELAGLLARVNDVPGAQTVSPQAIQKIKAISANLRRLKVTKGRKDDFNDLKPKYLALQEQASQQVVQQVVRLANVPGAWEALNVQPAFEELDREERSIPGMTQVQIPGPGTPILPPPGLNQGPPPGFNPGPPPGFNPGPPPGANPGPNPPPNNRPRPGGRRGANRPNFNGPG